MKIEISENQLIERRLMSAYLAARNTMKNLKREEQNLINYLEDKQESGRNFGHDMRTEFYDDLGQARLKVEIAKLIFLRKTSN